MQPTVRQQCLNERLVRVLRVVFIDRWVVTHDVQLLQSRCVPQEDGEELVAA